MAKIFKTIRAENFNSLKSLLEPKGFKVRAFPLRETIEKYIKEYAI